MATSVERGAGAFNPTDPKVRLYFELNSTAGGDGWPAAAGHEIRIDNINYSTPRCYVRPAPLGNDNNNGLTEATAYRTVDKAVDNAAGGQTIVVMDGTYTGTSDLGVFIKAGTPDGWIVLKNYPGAKPILQSSGWNVIKVGRGTEANPYTGPDIPSYIEVRGLTLRGFSSVDANGDRELAPQFLDTIGFAQSPSNTNGIFAEGRYSTLLPRHLRFADNLVEFCPGGGIVTARVDRTAIENNLIRNNCWWMIYAGSGISYLSSADAEQGNAYRLLVQGNVCHDNETMIPWYRSNGQNFSDGNGIIIDSHEPTYSGRTLVQNNLVYNNGGSGIHVFKAHRVDIVHNTAYLNSASSRLTYQQIYARGITAQPAFDVRITNNILVAPVNATGDSNLNESITVAANVTAGTIFYKNNLTLAATPRRRPGVTSARTLPAIRSSFRQPSTQP